MACLFKQCISFSTALASNVCAANAIICYIFLIPIREQSNHGYNNGKSKGIITNIKELINTDNYDYIQK